MTLPKKVKIGHMEYAVSLDQKLLSGTSYLSSTEYAYFDSWEKKIGLNPQMPSEMQASEFLHEIFHGLFFTTGLTRTYGNYPAQHEEEIVTHLSRGLCTVFKDNPKLLDYFKEAICAE